jgi:hypothetical protein
MHYTKVLVATSLAGALLIPSTSAFASPAPSSEDPGDNPTLIDVATVPMSLDCASITPEGENVIREKAL